MHADEKSTPDHSDSAAEDDLSYDADSDPDPAGTEGKLNVTPGSGGYEGRDPASEMPSMPSVPETWEEPAEHDAAPDESKDRPAHE